MIEMLQAYIEKYEADAARLASRTQNTRCLFFELLVIVVVDSHWPHISFRIIPVAEQ